MDIIVIGTPNDDAADVRIVNMLGRIDVFEVRQHLEDGLPIAVIVGFEVRPDTIVVMHVVELIKQVKYYSC